MKTILFVSLLMVIGFNTRLLAQDKQKYFNMEVYSGAGYRTLDLGPQVDSNYAVNRHEAIRPTFGINLLFEWELKSWLSISTGLNYQYLSYGSGLGGGLFSGSGGGFLSELNCFNSLGIPISAKFILPVKSKTSPYFKIGIMPKIYVHIARSAPDRYDQYQHVIPPSVFNTEGQFSIGAEVKVGKYNKLDFFSRFHIDMLNIFNSTGIKEHPYSFCIGIGFKFGVD